MGRRIKKSNIKLLIPLVLLFMLVGFATISTTLSINGDMELLSDLEDFSVYYSKALVNGVEDTSIIKSSTELDFGAVLKTVGVDYVIEYDLTNASSAFDAQVSINCSASTEYFSINNEFDSDTPIGARQTRTGVMTLRKIKTVSGDEQSNTISCDMVATPVERTEEGSGEVPRPLLVGTVLGDGTNMGDEINIGGEHFYVISNDGVEAVLLSKYNLEVGSTCVYIADTDSYICTEIENPSGIQNSKAIGYNSPDSSTIGYYGVVPFADSNYWRDSSNTLLPLYGSEYPAYVYDDNASIKFYVDSYRNYLEGLGLYVNDARLINFEELTKIGCIKESNSCGVENSWSFSTSYWTGVAQNTGALNEVYNNGHFGSYPPTGAYYFGVRPVIVIPAFEI